MEFFKELLKEVDILEVKEHPISKIAHDYEFEILDVNLDGAWGDWYTIFNAIKKYDDYLIELKIETKDKYSSFGDDEEPYRNEIVLFKESKEIQSKVYTYFK